MASYGGTKLKSITDKDVYEIGDVAKVLVNTAFDHVWAIAAVEGRDLISHDVVELQGHTAAVRDPNNRRAQS